MSELHVGLYVLQIARLSSAGYPMGQLVTPDAPVNGTVYSPYVVPAPIEYTPASSTEEEAHGKARGKIRGRMPLGVSDLGTGTLTLSEFDDTFDPLVMGTTRDTTTATAGVAVTSNRGRNTPRKFLVGFTPAALAVDSTIKYATIWKWGYFTRSELGANSGTGENPNNLSYTFYPTLSLRTPFGQLFSAAAVAPDNGSDAEYIQKDTYPMALTTYVDDGSGTSILQAYTPYYSEHAGAHNLFYKNGVENKANVSSLSSKTWTVTAGTAADVWCIMTPSAEILSIAG